MAKLNISKLALSKYSVISWKVKILKNSFSLSVKIVTGIIDKLNDRLTSYRLVLYFLIALVVWAVAGSFFKQVPYTAAQILESTAVLLAICWITNKLVSRFLNIPANKESDLITALILVLILTPPTSGKGLAVLAAAAIAAIVSKYVIVYNKSHLLNPAAAGAFVAGRFFHIYPAWWVGTKFLTPLVVIGGVLVLRKMRRFTMAGVFLAVFSLYLIYGSSSGANLHYIWLQLISTQALFFAVIMLSEPMTSPTINSKIIAYAAVVGVLYSVTKLKLSPEEALLLGNLFTFIIARNRRYKLQFVGKIKEAEGIFSYAFSMPPRFKFQPGQYMEWTIAQNKTDSRGNRRYLTISSSPTEPGLLFTLKRPPKASAFKQKLDELVPGSSILAAHLAGSFTMPKDPNQKLAFMAGGVGITPFRSMVKYLVDSGQKRDAALLYSVNSSAEVSFQKLFDQAKPAGLKPHYITDGHIDEARITDLLPDYTERRFYISGPYGFVNSVQTALLKLGVSASAIVTDYFPGYG